MAKIDVKAIEGYESMTTEQKVAALEAYDSPEPDMSGYVKKTVYDKAASDAAEWKRKHNALLTDEQKKQQEQSESLAQMRQELEALRKEKTVSEYKAKYLSLGFDDKLAQETASAMADGDTDKVFANMKKAGDAAVQSAIAERMKSTPRGVGGTDGSGNGMDYVKAISEAQARSDIAAVAYYTRLQAQECAGNNQ